MRMKLFISFHNQGRNLTTASRSSLMATFRFAFNRRASEPGNEISSATHFGRPYRFLKLCRTASTGYATPRRPGPLGTVTPPPASGLEVTRAFRPRGGPAIPSALLQRALGGTRGRHRGPVTSGDRVGAQGWVIKQTLGSTRRLQVRPAPPAGRRDGGFDRVTSAATAPHEPARGQRGTVRGPGQSPRQRPLRDLSGHRRPAPQGGAPPPGSPRPARGTHRAPPGGRPALSRPPRRAAPGTGVARPPPPPHCSPAGP